jgi:hypothetical protein
MKNITLKKHKTYNKDNKVVIVSFSKSAKSLLKKSNVFTRKLIVPVLINFLKQEIVDLKDVKINWLDNLSWAERVDETCNSIKFKLKFESKMFLWESYDLAEKYWLNMKNNMTNEIDSNLKDSYIGCYAYQYIMYDDVKEIIFDMNKMFDYLDNLDR